MPQERKKKQFSVKVYDQKHLRNLSRRMRKVQALLDEAARKGAAIGARTGYKDIEKEFRFDDFPQARREIDTLLRELSAALTINVEEADSEAWGMANAKNDAMVDAMIASTGVDMAKKVTQPWYNKNARALGAFQKRVKDGMGLSTDVWNLGQFKGELELALEMGLGRGKSAAELSRDVRSFLKYPDKLFRRVKDEKGVLRLSKAAQEFHPGRGVYRSSYKNALRLTATETNMAYRSADSRRWQQIPFVIGIKIQCSKTNHPVVDICDELAGDYPKDFVFTGWHPFCRCFATSILPPPDKFMEYQKAVIDGKDVSEWNWDGEVKDVPENFDKWVKDNEERISNAKSLPYFIKDNAGYVANSLSEPAEILGLIGEYKAIQPKHMEFPLNGTVAMDLTGGLATAAMKGFTGLINSYYEAESNKEKVAVLQRIIENKSFSKIKYHSTKDNSIFAIGYEPFDRLLKKGEMPKNLAIAKKMLPHGYDVYMLPNPNSNVSADFILSKKGKLYYAEGKTLNGKNSLDNRLRGGARQAERVLVDVIGTDDPRYIASTIEAAFEQNNGLSEVILLKGSREIKVSRREVNHKSFFEKFKIIWNKQK